MQADFALFGLPPPLKLTRERVGQSADALRCQIRLDHGPASDDGRSSLAMLNLLCSLRVLRREHSVAVSAFDLPWGAPGEVVPPDIAEIFSVPRDQAMATLLLAAIEQRRDAMTVVLAGNEHTRLASRRHDGSAPLGDLLNRAFGDVVSLIGHNQGGTIRAATTSQGAERTHVYADSTPIGLGWFATQ